MEEVSKKKEKMKKPYSLLLVGFEAGVRHMKGPLHMDSFLSAVASMLWDILEG